MNLKVPETEKFQRERMKEWPNSGFTDVNFGIEQ